ncbi:MAG: TylF/MycF/NovP-related O-methyltransferase [Bacteroidota bacterium]
MKSKFGILGKLEFLQNISSSMISSVNPAVIHNIEKYLAIKKTVYLNSLEHQKGDYLEFGVYTGSSFCHTIKCFKKTEKFNPYQKETRFIGFDSFEGFGELDEDDKHPFYVDQNFTTSYTKVKKRAEKTIKGWGAGCQMVQGYFEDSLKEGPAKYGIENIRIAFIDSDTYSSSKCAFQFIKNNVKSGSHIILDDFYSYNGDPKKGVSLAFNEFLTETGFKYRRILDYGMGGIVVVLYK